MAVTLFTVTHILCLYTHMTAELTMKRQVIYTKELRKEVYMHVF